MLTPALKTSHRKTHPYITERLLMGRKESKQTNYAALPRGATGLSVVCDCGIS